MKLATIGFTQTTAKSFFSRLAQAGVKRVIDVRLNNTSQLAGFAKAKDLAYFLEKIGQIHYEHQPLLAPTQDILDAFKKHKGDWGLYERQFTALMTARQIEHKFEPSQFDGGCLLCSEAKPHYCHRKLVAEYLSRHWSVPVTILHL